MTQENPPTPTKPAFSTLFAVVTAAVLIVLLWVFAQVSGALQLSVSLGDEAAKADPRAVLAARVIGPVLVLGVALLAVGVWMVLVEWKAAFAAADVAEVRTSGLSVGDVIDSLAKLKGSSLILISGIVLILSVGWMVGATVDGGDGASGASASATASPTPSSTSMPTPIPDPQPSPSKK